MCGPAPSLFTLQPTSALVDNKIFAFVGLTAVFHEHRRVYTDGAVEINKYVNERIYLGRECTMGLYARHEYVTGTYFKV